MTTIGATAVKNHLTELLERVAAGESIAITRHGHEVARLVPPPNGDSQFDLAVAAAQWKKARKGVNLKGLKVRDLLNQGRR